MGATLAGRLLQCFADIGAAVLLIPPSVLKEMSSPPTTLEMANDKLVTPGEVTIPLEIHGVKTSHICSL